MYTLEFLKLARVSRGPRFIAESSLALVLFTLKNYSCVGFRRRARPLQHLRQSVVKTNFEC